MNRPFETTPLSGGEHPSWDPREVFVLPAVRSWGMVLCVTILGILAGTFVALTKPNEYTSIAKVAALA